MENKEIKEKLLCALNKNAHKLRENLHRNRCYKGGHAYTSHILEIGFEEFIMLNKVGMYETITTSKTIPIKTYFWQKDKTEDVTVTDYEIIGYKGEITFNNEIFEIDKEEYDEILKSKEKLLKEEVLEKLEKLC